MKLVCAELSLRKGRDRLLDIFLRQKSRSADGFLEWRKVEWAGFEESDGIPPKSGSRILILAGRRPESPGTKE